MLHYQAGSDLMISTKMLSKFQSKSNECLWKSAKPILRYIRGSLSSELYVFADADWMIEFVVTWSKQQIIMILLCLYENSIQYPKRSNNRKPPSVVLRYVPERINFHLPVNVTSSKTKGVTPFQPTFLIIKIIHLLLQSKKLTNDKNLGCYLRTITNTSHHLNNGTNYKQSKQKNLSRSKRSTWHLNISNCSLSQNIRSSLKILTCKNFGW